VVGHPLDTVDDIGEVALAPAVQHPDRDEPDLLRHAVCGAADRAGHVGAVAAAVIGVRVVGDEVVAVDGPAAELLVNDLDTGVDDVGVHRVSVGHRRVRLRQAARPLVDPVESPDRVGLRRGDPHDAVLLDDAHGRVGRQPAGVRGTQPDGQCGVAPVLHLPGDEALRGRAEAARAGAEDDDVPAGHRAGGVGTNHDTLGGTRAPRRAVRPAGRRCGR
jgi:hypothetical protein